MTVLIIHASLEGQSARIADFAERVADDLGHRVIRRHVDDMRAPLPVDRADQVILVAPIHERRHPDTFELLVETERAALSGKPTCLVSVSLNAAFPEGRDEAADYVTEFEMRTGFSPDHIVLAAGAVRTETYDYYAAQIVQHVVLKDRDADLRDGSHEFTDWDALEADLRGFLALQPA